MKEISTWTRKEHASREREATFLANFSDPTPSPRPPNEGPRAHMKVIQGNLIKLAQDGTFDVIVHGCNCQCTMGSGVAKAIKASFPAAYEVDCATEEGDPSKLGTISVAKIDLEGRQLAVVNGYTQFGFGGPKEIDYEALRGVMRSVRNRFTGKRIGYPRIGAGLGGGDWAVISAIITEELLGEDHALAQFEGEVTP